jgi:predicted lactoylglutathione lyase
MVTSMFVTLPVADPAKSLAFYEAVGFARDPRFADGSACCVMLNDKVSVMLGSKEVFTQISPRPYVEPTQACNVLLSVNCESKEELEGMVAKAIAAGGSKAHEFEDHGFMEQGAFYDLDGHGWGLTWMNPNPAK